MPTPITPIQPNRLSKKREALFNTLRDLDYDEEMIDNVKKALSPTDAVRMAAVAAIGAIGLAAIASVELQQEWVIEEGACPECTLIAAGGPYPLGTNIDEPHPNCKCSWKITAKE
jgi:hypothetical protein